MSLSGHSNCWKTRSNNNQLAIAHISPSLGAHNMNSNILMSIDRFALAFYQTGLGHQNLQNLHPNLMELSPNVIGLYHPNSLGFLFGERIFANRVYGYHIGMQYRTCAEFIKKSCRNHVKILGKSYTNIGESCKHMGGSCKI